MKSAVLNVFKIGVGPSSSHTVGPMIAANRFINQCDELSIFPEIVRVQVDLYGSLALTGVGHATDKAVLLGLMGELPDLVDTETMKGKVADTKKYKQLNLAGKYKIDWDADSDLLFHFLKALPEHANGMTISAFAKNGEVLLTDTFFSIGGGLVKSLAEFNQLQEEAESHSEYDFATASQLQGLCQKYQCGIAPLMWKIEKEHGTLDDTRQALQAVWQVMQDCAMNGLHRKTPLLPGGLNIQRRAPALYQSLISTEDDDPSILLEWLSVYALAVNEENAAGKRVVTAPTNGSAGVVPAIMLYAKKYYPEKFTEQAALDFLITASAIGLLYQKGASISAAEMGCQGEIGVSSSMAAAAMCEFLGGSVDQTANAAEIAMEHHLGMTCDPISGLVQVPCIERNTMGAVKALNAAKLALRRNDQLISLDQVIKTMWQTGIDMSHKYKETAQGGLAVHVLVDDKDRERLTDYKITKNQVAC